MKQSLFAAAIFMLLAHYVNIKVASTARLNLTALCANVTVDEYDIIEELMKRKPIGKRYKVRPIANGAKPISVGVRLVLSTINEILERVSHIRLTFYLAMRWQHDFYIYNETMPFACIESLTFPPDTVWLPDMAMINSHDLYEVISGDPFNRVRMYSNGTFSHRPGGTYDAFCKFDMTWFPFDEQTCTLAFEAWRYTLKYQQFYFLDPPISTRYWIENEHWLVVNYSSSNVVAKYVSDSVYDRVEFTLKLRRKIGYYMVNVIIPSFIISIAQLAVFSLPVEEAMKMHISFTCLLAYGVFELMIIEDIPRSSDHIPLLSIYITMAMLYIAFAILGQGVSFLCFKMAELGEQSTWSVEKKKTAPRWAVTIAIFIAKLLCMKIHTDSVRFSSYSRKTTRPKRLSTLPIALSQGMIARDSFGSDDAPKRYTIQRTPSFISAVAEGCGELSKESRDWHILANVVDRLTFFIYLFITLVTPFIMFLVLPAILKDKE